jgi:hypothetical protein
MEIFLLCGRTGWSLPTRDCSKVGSSKGRSQKGTVIVGQKNASILGVKTFTIPEAGVAADDDKRTQKVKEISAISVAGLRSGTILSAA